MSDPIPAANLSLSLDDIIKQRRSEKKIEEQAKAVKKRTPIKSKENHQQQKSKPTSAQKATGSSKAKRDAKMAAKRGLSNSSKPTRGNVDKEIHRQQRAGSTKQSRGSSSVSVYVGNLAYKTRWQDLKDHMRKAGNVDKVTILEGNDGRSKGCGIVVYQHPKDAQRAIRELADSTLDDRPIFVREDREDSKTNEKKTNSPELCVFVGNIAFESSWQDLKDHMRGAGNVDSAKIMQYPDGRPKGCGLVVYQHPKDVQRAIREMSGSVLHGRNITVRQNREQSDPRPGPPAQGNQSSGGQLYVGNLAWETSWQDLKDFFATVGNVDRAEVIVGVDGRPKGFGIVRYYNTNDADAAITKLDGAELDGRALHVRLDNKS